ncbi:glycosyltransferase family 2 protein [Thermoleophilia bacterium SCSIO 60948]|nr:glycosyltransferase family 2 protein [Thermoleophilia bacterium SCSIO 60948]
MPQTHDNRTQPTGLTVIVPAFNEAESVAETVRSLLGQTAPPERLIVIDDCSTDDTADVARSAGAEVVKPPANTGSKAGAQNFALELVDTEFVMAVDADTTLEPEAIEKLLPSLDDRDVAAACGFVLPRHVGTIWERGRYVEYLLAFSFFKRIQDYFGKPLISSGCFSVYRTDELRAAGAWQTRTMAEDMDLTWTLYSRGHKVRFEPDAVSYPIEPHNLEFMGKQLKRWSHGFVQNVRLHWRTVLDLGYLRSIVTVGFWDAVMASFAYLILLPVLAVLVDPLFLLAYLVDAPLVMVPVLWQAHSRGETLKALASFPSFFVLRIVNGAFMLAALWREFVVRRPLLVYEKGH